jgi:uncharacterized protein HemY
MIDEESGIKHNSIVPADTEFVHIFADSYNYLGMLWTGRNDPKKAEKYLKRAEKIYDSYKTYVIVAHF